MDALTRLWVVALIAWCGCAGSPAREPSPVTVDETAWGDEYAGIDDDADVQAVLAGAARTSGRTSATIHALFEPDYEGANAPLRSLTASARTRHAAARFRRAGSVDAGAVELFDVGPVAHVVAGAIRPRVGEGAWLADARELGTPVALGTTSVTALRVAPSSLRWGSVLGAGAAVDAGRARISAAAWRPHDDDTTWTAWSGIEWRFARTVAGVAAGKTARARPVASWIVAHRFRSAFACLETASTDAGIVFAARVVAGEVWRAALASGAAARPGSYPRDRRVAVVERRDTWRGLQSRAAVSSVMERAGPEHERHRRVDWRVRIDVDARARVEGGVRFAERVATVAPSPLDRGKRTTREEWRARVAFVVREQPSPSLYVEHVFRVDAVQTGTSPGFGGTWRGTVRRGPLDVRAQASAWGLRTGQTAYLGRGGLPGSGAFTAASGSGSDLSLALRARAWGHATAAAEWRRSASGDERVLVGMTLDW